MRNQSGGGHNMSYRFFHPHSTPFKPCNSCGCTKKKQKGGAIRMPYRYFHPNAKPFQSCGSCGARADAVYYNEFVKNQGCQGYNSCNMTGGASRRTQRGGFPTGAPFKYFEQGAPLQYNYKMSDAFRGAPTFDHVGRNNFW